MTASDSPPHIFLSMVAFIIPPSIVSIHSRHAHTHHPLKMNNFFTIIYNILSNHFTNTDTCCHRQYLMAGLSPFLPILCWITFQTWHRFCAFYPPPSDLIVTVFCKMLVKRSWPVSNWFHTWAQSVPKSQCIITTLLPAPTSPPSSSIFWSE